MQERSRACDAGCSPCHPWSCSGHLMQFHPMSSSSSGPPCHQVCACTPHPSILYVASCKLKWPTPWHRQSMVEEQACCVSPSQSLIRGMGRLQAHFRFTGSWGVFTGWQAVGACSCACLLVITGCVHGVAGGGGLVVHLLSQSALVIMGCVHRVAGGGQRDKDGCGGRPGRAVGAGAKPAAAHHSPCAPRAGRLPGSLPR